MAGPYLNDEHPDIEGPHAEPKRVVMGIVDEGVSMDDVARSLTDSGIASERIHFFRGERGVELLEPDRQGVLDKMAGAFEHPDHPRTTSVEALKDGRTLVAVHDVEEDESTAMRGQLKDAGIGETHYFGEWVFD